MSETKFTPGPWAAHLGWARDGGQPDNEYPDWCEVTGGDGLSIIGHYGIANANLIAAAPDLYGALSIMLKRYVDLAGSGDCGNWNPEDEDQVKTARTALAKAHGETK